MTKKSTKRSLLLSVLSLLVCCSMLIGSTFAWFTDSVTSGSNVITSGNLDIEVQYTLDGTNWSNLQGATDLFSKGLWEPGHTEVVVLKIENKGSLALKYNANMNIFNETIGKTKDGKDIVLSDILTVSTLTQQVNAIGDITVDLAFAGENRVAYEVTAPFKNAGILKANNQLLSGDAQYMVIKVDMAETVGNEANHNGIDIPAIEFGINVVAAQYTYEFDSFGNDYDKDAYGSWSGTVPASLDKTSLIIKTSGGAQTGTITVNTPEDLVYLNKLAAEWVSLYSNGQGTNVGSYRENVGGKGTDYYYHWTWDIELANDLDMSNIPMNSVDISYWGDFDAKGHTISNVVLKDGQDGLFINGAKAVNNLTVKNITVNAPDENTVGAVSGNGSMTNVHVENAKVIGGKYVGGICGKGSSFVNCSIKNSTVTGADKTVGGLVGYSIGDPDTASVTGNLVENVSVIGAYNVGGLLGQSQNETVEGNTVKNVTVMSTSKLPANASTNEVLAAELAARSAFANTTIGNNTIENVTVKSVTGVKTADDLVNAFANLKAGETIYIVNDIDMTGKTVTPVTGNKSFTMLGNGHTIKNLNSTERALFVAHSGSAAYTFEDVVLENCSVDSATNYAALFVGDGDTSDAITIKNCVVKNCTVKSAKYAAAFIGYTAGYNVQNNGPVYSDVLIENCSVIGGSITGGGSVGAAIGHAGGNVDTTSTITGLKVDGVAINGEDAEHTGIVVGTAHIGKTIINATTYANVTGNYNTSTVLYGRFVPGTTGSLTIDGIAI